MSKKNKIFILIVIIGISMFLVGLFIPIINRMHIDSSNTKVYEDIINKIDDKDTFNILITDDDEINKMFSYYEDTYSLTINEMSKNDNNDSYKKMVDKLNININDLDDNIFVAVKDGVVVASITGIFSESNLREVLIDNKIIDKKYKEIDNLIENNFKEYYNNEEDAYTILLINYDDNNKNDYRELLVKNNIKSVVIYTGAGDTKAVKEIRDITGSDTEAYEKTPIVINVKNKKIVNYYTKVKLDEFLEKIIK